MHYISCAVGNRVAYGRVLQARQSRVVVPQPWMLGLLILVAIQHSVLIVFNWEGICYCCG